MHAVCVCVCVSQGPQPRAWDTHLVFAAHGDGQVGVVGRQRLGEEVRLNERLFCRHPLLGREHDEPREQIKRLSHAIGRVRVSE